jgi:membrane-associated phospholipid phosphatase
MAFQSRNVPQFVNLLTGFLAMVVFNLALTVLTYAGTPLNAPVADDLLMRTDAALGIHLPSIVEWTQQRPVIQRLLNIAYVSVLPSTLLAIVMLGLDQNLRRLQHFVLQFMLAGLLTTLVFFLLPAKGPFVAYGYDMRPDQMRFLAHFQALRAGEFPVISMDHLEGLITFPSFHTTWALLVAFAFRHYRWLFPFMLVLNLAVVASTMTTGWHYGADVIGGTVTAVVAVLVSRVLVRSEAGEACGVVAAALVTDPAS